MKQDRMTEKNESGRSLIEMLGVLAVMGVLTIGAIAGFNYAMNKQRANATVNYVNQLAIEGSRQMLAGSNHLSLLDYPDKTPSGYGVELGLLSDTNAYFEVYVQDVPEAVCSQIQAMAKGWRGLDTLWINEDGKDCNKELNTMSFIFTDSLSRGTSGTRCTSDEGCTGCQTCQRGFCTDTDSACPVDTPNCVSGSCETCPAEEFQDNKGKCHPCSGNTIDNVDPAECQKCIGKRFYYQNFSRCVSCNDTAGGGWQHAADRTSCLACSNRYFIPSGNDSEWGTCPYCNGKVVTDEKGETVCQGNCPDGEVWAKEGCKDCDDPAIILYTVQRQSCRNKCSGFRFPELNFTQCTRCDFAGYRTSTIEDCASCPNRYWRGRASSNEGLCYLCNGEVLSDAYAYQICHGECPDGEVWSGSACVPCDTSDTNIGPVYGSDCARQCKGVRFSRSYYSECIRCDIVTDFSGDRESCLACGNRTWEGGYCRLCTGTVSADGKSCITQ